MSGSLDTPVSRTSLRHEVYSRLRAALMSGEIGHNDSITETAIADQLGTSRAPVREALRQLEQEGLIVSRGNRGYGIPSASEHAVKEIARVRVALEKLAVVLFVERAEPGDYAALETLIEEMRIAIQSGDAEQANKIDQRFHERLCEGARHELLLSMWGGMRAQLTLAMRAINMSFPSQEGLVERHRELLEAVSSGNPDRAERAIESHVLHGIELLDKSESETSAA